jgi:hypothetical protein
VQNGGLGGGSGRCQLSDGHGDEQTNSRIEQENYLAGSQVRKYWIFRDEEKKNVVVRMCLAQARFFCLHLGKHFALIRSKRRNVNKRQKDKKKEEEVTSIRICESTVTKY